MYLDLDVYGEQFCEEFEAVKGEEVDPDVQMNVFLEETVELAESIPGSENELKEMCDVIITVCNLAYIRGHSLSLALSEVHQSNLTKFRDARFNTEGKLLKGPHYRKPDLSEYVGA